MIAVTYSKNCGALIREMKKIIARHKETPAYKAFKARMVGKPAKKQRR